LALKPKEERKQLQFWHR